MASFIIHFSLLTKSTIMINQTIQSFTISEELGSGGMATVYLAENSIGKKVAIKVLAKQYFHN